MRIPLTGPWRRWRAKRNQRREFVRWLAYQESYRSKGWKAIGDPRCAVAGCEQLATATFDKEHDGTVYPIAKVCAEHTAEGCVDMTMNRDRDWWRMTGTWAR